MSVKRLTRPTGDRVFLGVCAGIANYFEVDPTIVRLLFVLAIFMSGTGVLAYFVLALVMPTADGTSAISDASDAPPPAADRPSTLGDDVVRTVDEAVANATKDAEQAE